MRHCGPVTFGFGVEMNVWSLGIDVGYARLFRHGWFSVGIGPFKFAIEYCPA